MKEPIRSSDPRVSALNDQIKLVEYEKDLYDRRNLMSNESAQRIPGLKRRSIR